MIRFLGQKVKPEDCCAVVEPPEPDSAARMAVGCEELEAVGACKPSAL